MKPGVLFSCSLLFAAASAVAAPDPNSCVPGSMQLKPAERAAYVDSCMAQVSSPTNVKEEFERSKLSFCEQNVKNMKLKGTGRSSYMDTCMHSNEAEAAAQKDAVRQAAARENAAKMASRQSGKCGCPAVAQSTPQKPAMHKKTAKAACKKPDGKTGSMARKRTAGNGSKA